VRTPTVSPDPAGWSYPQAILDAILLFPVWRYHPVPDLGVTITFRQAVEH